MNLRNLTLSTFRKNFVLNWAGYNDDNVIIEVIIVTQQHPEDASNTDERTKTEDSDLPLNLPKTQRDLFLRIQAQQKDNVVETQKDTAEDNVLNNDNWYSDDEDDDDDDRLMIKVDNEDVREKNEEEDEDRNDARWV